MAIQLPILSTFDNRGVKKANSAIGGLTKRVVGFGAAVGAAFAVRAVTNFTRDSISAASDLQESLNAVQVAFGDAGDAIIKLGEDAAQGLGVSQAEFNAAAVRFSAFADRVVGEGGDVAGFIDDISTRATDFASVFNIDVAEALQVFQSGLAGEAEPLKRFGINLLQAEVQTYALEAGIISVGESMTEQDKVQARYGLLMQETAKTAGDFANTSDSLANSQRILAANFQDVRAEVGTALLPVLEDLSQFMVDEVIPPLMEFFQDDFPGIVEGATPVVEGFISVLDDVAEGVKSLLDIPDDTSLLEGLLDKIAETQADPEFQKFMGELRDIFVELAPVVPDLAIGIAELAKAIAPLLGDAAEETAPTLTALSSILGDLAASVRILTGTLPDGEDAVKDFELTWLDFIPVISSYIGSDGLIAKLADAVRRMRQGLEREAPQIRLFWETFTKVAKSAVTDTEAGVKGTLENMRKIFSNTFDRIKRATQGWRDDIVNAVRSGIDRMYRAGLDVIQGLWDGVRDRFNAVRNWFENLMNQVRYAIRNPGDVLRDVGRDVMQGLWNGLKDRWDAVRRWLDNVMNRISRGAKAILGIRSPSKVFYEIGENVSKGLLLGLDSLEPQIQQQVQTLVPTAPLAVPPLTPLPPVEPVSRMIGSPTQNVYNVTVNAGVGTSGAEVGREVVNAIRDYERRNGRVFATA